jgi:hypothetical protein
MTLALIILGLAFDVFNQLNDASDLAGSMADVNENLRASVNLVARDLSEAGAQIPLGGIPLPGGNAATLINRPGPGATTFPNTGYLSIITPGTGLGPTIGGYPTDAVTIISVNPTSQLNAFPLIAISSDNSHATITVDPRTNIAAGASQVLPGQLIMLENATTCLLAVTAVDPATNIITFTNGAAPDVLGLNQFPPNATTGTIAQLPPVAASTTAYQLNMITYYIYVNAPNPPQLMRLLGTNANGNQAQAVALGVNLLQFSYSLSPPATPTDPTNVVGNPNQIRKVNLWVNSQANHPNRRTGQYYSNSIKTSVVVQNLAFFNKY